MLTWVEINQSSIEHNLKSFRKIIGSAVLLIPVIKANAYGHGLVEMAKICDEIPEVDRLAVANLNEALLLRLINIEKPIQVLSFFENDLQKIAEGIKKQIIFPIYTIEQAKTLNSVCERIGLTCKIHLKIDTGTSRVGFLTKNLAEVGQTLKKFTKLKIEGIWSHFSSSEDNLSITKKQNSDFKKGVEVLKKQGISPEINHVACTAATILYPFSHHDAVRVGIGTYGLYPSLKLSKKISLKPVLSWKTTVIQTKLLAKGTKIGYGGTHVLKKDTKIAIIPIGYYDGFRRDWGNKAHVLISGEKCPVIGRVCMNLSMIDVSKAPDCTVGSTVTLIGEDKKGGITADELSKLTPGTINYEIVTNINPLIPRIVV